MNPPATGTAVPQSSDTSLDVEEILLAGYRRMTPAEKLQRVADLNRAVQQLALARGDSDRQWTDLLGVLKVPRGRLDQEYLRAGALHLEVTDLLDRALTEAGIATA